MRHLKKLDDPSGPYFCGGRIRSDQPGEVVQEQVDVSLAERFLTAFDATIFHLSSQPEIGKPRRFRAKELVGLRSIAVQQAFGMHLIFYRFSENVISIERILHGARDLPNRLAVGNVHHSLDAFFQFDKRTVSGEVADLTTLDLGTDRVTSVDVVTWIGVDLANAEYYKDFKPVV